MNIQAIAPDAPGVRRDKARGDGGPDADWEKRIYASADSGQRVIVHVRRSGAANWRYALLFRDWLRASPGPRAEYAALKTKLATVHGTDAHFDDYARAKDHWFDRAQAAMEKWAQSTGWGMGDLFRDDVGCDATVSGGADTGARFMNPRERIAMAPNVGRRQSPRAFRKR
ncbi:GrpB family protein [Microbacterium oxydans]|uniref:GrpB family protein n=1 Tax=Microbacterium oxydans TaxID=82380 RepID=UPI003B00803A